jgi:hypothetical protein
MQSAKLSKNAFAVLRLRTKGLCLPATDCRLEGNRELTEAGIMAPDGGDFCFTADGLA